MGHSSCTWSGRTRRRTPLGLDAPAALAVEPLLRELILAHTGTPGDDNSPEGRRLRAVLLAEDTPVTAVAHRCGWASASAFIDVFRRAYGHTPGRHLPRGR